MTAARSTLLKSPGDITSSLLLLRTRLSSVGSQYWAIYELRFAVAIRRAILILCRMGLAVLAAQM